MPPWVSPSEQQQRKPAQAARLRGLRLWPGARLGLANIATLVVLARFGGPTAALFGILRHLVVSLAAGLLLRLPAGEACVVHVYVAGQERLQVHLTRAREYHLDLSGGHMLLQVEPGRIRVVESDCDDQVCLLSGWADRPGRPIYCAPYRTLITVTGGRSDVDGLLR